MHQSAMSHKPSDYFRCSMARTPSRAAPCIAVLLDWRTRYRGQFTDNRQQNAAMAFWAIPTSPADKQKVGRGGGDRTIRPVANTQVIDYAFRQILQKRSSNVQKRYKRHASICVQNLAATRGSRSLRMRRLAWNDGSRHPWSSTGFAGKNPT